MANGEIVGSSSVLRDAPPFNHTPPRSQVGSVSRNGRATKRRRSPQQEGPGDPDEPRGASAAFYLTLFTSSGASRYGRKGRAAARARATAPSTEHGGRARAPTAKSFFVHHTQQLAAAAQVGDAKGIRKKITKMKMRLIKDALIKASGRAQGRAGLSDSRPGPAADRVRLL